MPQPDNLKHCTSIPIPLSTVPQSQRTQKHIVPSSAVTQTQPQYPQRAANQALYAYLVLIVAPILLLSTKLIAPRCCRQPWPAGLWMMCQKARSSHWRSCRLGCCQVSRCPSVRAYRHVVMSTDIRAGICIDICERGHRHCGTLLSKPSQADLYSYGPIELWPYVVVPKPSQAAASHASMHARTRTRTPSSLP